MPIAYDGKVIRAGFPQKMQTELDAIEKGQGT